MATVDVVVVNLVYGNEMWFVEYTIAGARIRTVNGGKHEEIGVIYSPLFLEILN